MEGGQGESANHCGVSESVTSSAYFSETKIMVFLFLYVVEPLLKLHNTFKTGGGGELFSLIKSKD